MKNSIAFGAFISGMVVMIFEIVGARIIGPFFGTSMYVWTSIIGIILVSLSVGYRYGGKRADEVSSVQDYTKFFLYAAVSMLIVLLLKDSALQLIAQITSDIRIGAVISGIVLFAVPSFFFGVISPYAIQLLTDSVSKTGTTSGSIYALSTIGSIIGTFMGGFFLVPLLGINIVLSLCIVLMVIAAIVLQTSIWKNASAVALIACAFTAYSFTHDTGDTHTYMSPYSNIMVYPSQTAEGEDITIMRIDNHIGSAIYQDSDDLVYDYLKYFRLDNHVNKGFKKTLMIGGAACSYPKELIEQYEDVTVDIVEIDKTLIDIAHEHFRLPESDRLNYFYEDGRTFLNRNEDLYDIIYIDAFNSLFSVPFQLTTVEAIQLMKKSLHKDGAVLVNLLSVSSQQKNHFLRAELASYQSVFEHVMLLQINPDATMNEAQNFCLIASRNKISPESIYIGLNKKLKTTIEINTLDIPVLTDDIAPVEYYISKML